MGGCVRGCQHINFCPGHFNYNSNYLQKLSKDGPAQYLDG